MNVFAIIWAEALADTFEALLAKGSNNVLAGLCKENGGLSPSLTIQAYGDGGIPSTMPPDAVRCMQSLTTWRASRARLHSAKVGGPASSKAYFATMPTPMQRPQSWVITMSLGLDGATVGTLS